MAWVRSLKWFSFPFLFRIHTCWPSMGQSCLVTPEWDVLAHYPFVSISESLRLILEAVTELLHFDLHLWEVLSPAAPTPTPPPKPGFVMDSAACLINSSLNLWLLKTISCHSSLWRQWYVTWMDILHSLNQLFSFPPMGDKWALSLILRIYCYLLVTR